MKGSDRYCHEGYCDAEAVLSHLSNVGAKLDEILAVSELTRIDVTGPADELAKLKEALSKFPVTFFNTVSGHGCSLAGKSGAPVVEQSYFVCNGFWAVKPADVQTCVKLWDELTIATAQEHGSLYYSIALPEGYEDISEGDVPILIRGESTNDQLAAWHCTPHK